MVMTAIFWWWNHLHNRHCNENVTSPSSWLHNFYFLDGVGGKHVVYTNVVGGSSTVGFPLAIAVSERDMPGIEPVPVG